MGVGGSSASNTPQIPDELKGLITNSANQVQNYQDNRPLSMFGGYDPRTIADLGNLTKWGLDDISSLRAVQPGYLGSFAALATLPEVASQPIPTPGAELEENAMLDQLVGGPIGSSPATLAGMRAWEAAVKPVVEQDRAIEGLGRSGALVQSLTDSATQAFTPLVQQEIQNRVTSLGVLRQIADSETQRYMAPRQQTLDAIKTQAEEMRQLGGAMFQQQVSAIQMALQGGQITTDKAQQLYDAAYDEFLRLQALSEATTLGPLGQLAPSSIGSKQSGKSGSFDIGKAASIGAMLFGA